MLALGDWQVDSVLRVVVVVLTSDRLLLLPEVHSAAVLLSYSYRPTRSPCPSPRRYRPSKESILGSLLVIGTIYRVLDGKCSAYPRPLTSSTLPLADHGLVAASRPSPAPPLEA